MGQRISTFLETAGEFGFFSARVVRDAVRQAFRRVIRSERLDPARFR